MESIDLINLWKAQDGKIEQSLAINKKLLIEVISQKAESTLKSLIRVKALGIVAAFLYLMLLGSVLCFAISHYSSAASYFIISMSAIFLINLKALYDYIKHLVWITNINYDGSITEIQKKLTTLQLSIFKHNRIVILQLPFWTTFYLSNQWFPKDTSWAYIIFQLTLTGAFTYIAYWLYKNQTIENAEKKWIKMFISGSGGKSVMKALAFYKEIEQFKVEK